MVNEQKEENRIRNHRPLTVYRPLEGEEVSTKVFSGTVVSKRTIQGDSQMHRKNYVKLLRGKKGPAHICSPSRIKKNIPAPTTNDLALHICNHCKERCKAAFHKPHYSNLQLLGKLHVATRHLEVNIHNMQKRQNY
ncbi:hypothetical protein GOBAR_AA13016 [Gossypium barbadense]|uniref:Uncharacterized protein n=1 Tax=Gossypium barbadense TaxID=3634 RepID=A0A2P5XWE5_GOSBA|nr:hypothetical protein GOBAR_AA13016 [Gossypium barbadense]